MSRSVSACRLPINASGNLAANWVRTLLFTHLSIHSSSRLQCWSAVPSDRPTFVALHDFFREEQPASFVATDRFDGSSEQPLPGLGSGLTTSPNDSRRHMIVEPGDKVRRRLLMKNNA